MLAERRVLLNTGDGSRGRRVMDGGDGCWCRPVPRRPTARRHGDKMDEGLGPARCSRSTAVRPADNRRSARGAARSSQLCIVARPIVVDRRPATCPAGDRRDSTVVRHNTQPCTTQSHACVTLTSFQSRLVTDDNFVGKSAMRSIVGYFVKQQQT